MKKAQKKYGAKLSTLFATASLIIPSFIVPLIMATPAWSAKPEPWELNFQPPATEVMEDIDIFHDFLLIITIGITVLILCLLIYCVFRFNERANPEPSRVSHNTSLEIIWTTIPILILVLISIPSFNLLRKETLIPKPDMTIKVIGHQWYWEYEYSDEELSFDSVMIEEADLKPGQIRLLSVDNPLVVPVNKTVHVQVTASDVIHAFTVPAFGIKNDAVPGRLNETWFRVDQEGTYFGQCSELCGDRHAFMPIEVRVVSQNAYQRWLQSAKREFAQQNKQQDQSSKNQPQQKSETHQQRIDYVFSN